MAFEHPLIDQVANGAPDGDSRHTEFLAERVLVGKEISWSICALQDLLSQREEDLAV
jgi:hypothetical protein